METRDLLTLMAILVSVTTMLVVSRNARKATSVQVQNTDLTRIRDLRSEVRDLTHDLQTARAESVALRSENAQIRDQMVEIHKFANQMLQDRMEMIRYAQIPGVSITDWLDRYGNEDHPRPIGGTIDV